MSEEYRKLLMQTGGMSNTTFGFKNNLAIGTTSNEEIDSLSQLSTPIPVGNLCLGSERA